MSKEQGEVFSSLKAGRMPMDKPWHCGRPPSSSSPRQAQSVPPWPPRPCSSPLFFSSSHSSPPPPSLHYHPRQDQAQPLPWETARCTRCVSATRTVTRTRSASSTCATHGRWPHHIFSCSSFNAGYFVIGHIGSRKPWEVYLPESIFQIGPAKRFCRYVLDVTWKFLWKLEICAKLLPGYFVGQRPVQRRN